MVTTAVESMSAFQYMMRPSQPTRHRCPRRNRRWRSYARSAGADPRRMISASAFAATTIARYCFPQHAQLPDLSNVELLPALRCLALTLTPDLKTKQTLDAMS